MMSPDFARPTPENPYIPQHGERIVMPRDGHRMNGTLLAEKMVERLKEDVNRLPFQIGLAAILVGNDERSEKYVGMKAERAREIGIKFHTIRFAQSSSLPEIQGGIEELNIDPLFHGVMVQLPVPEEVYDGY